MVKTKVGFNNIFILYSRSSTMDLVAFRSLQTETGKITAQSHLCLINGESTGGDKVQCPQIFSWPLC